MASLKRRKPKPVTTSADQVFWISLEEAKRAIADKYEFLAERYDKRFKRK